MADSKEADRKADAAEEHEKEADDKRGE